MDERVLRFRVGVVVVASAIVTVVLVMLFGAWPTMLQPQYTLHIRFPEAPGDHRGHPRAEERRADRRVSRVELLDEGGVLVSTNINQNFTLRRNETCRIGTGSLLGDAVLEFVPAGHDELLARFDINRTGRLRPRTREVGTGGADRRRLPLGRDRRRQSAARPGQSGTEHQHRIRFDPERGRRSGSSRQVDEHGAGRYQ
jgi:hypothetical protein